MFYLFTLHKIKFMKNPHCTALAKKYFGSIFFILLTIHAFSQVPPKQHTYYRSPNSPKPSQIHHSSSSPFRSTCDTTLVLDYSTYNEVVAASSNLNFNGSWNSANPIIQAMEITPFVDVAHIGSYTYAAGIWDSLAFANLGTGQTSYYPLSATTVYLDSLGMFIGIWGDTVHAHNKMANDSLVFTVYSVANNSLSQIKKVVFSGYTGLSQFFNSPNILGFVPIAIHQQFNQGEGFAVRLDYLAKDTSSHLSLSYTYADSCGTVYINGNPYPSPAYPSPFAACDLYGNIDHNQAGTGATVYDANNSYAYMGQGFPDNCSFVYTQNWEFLPILNLCVAYGAQIQASSTSWCNGSTVELDAFVYGTNSSNITYRWSASGGGVITDSTSATTSIIQNSNINTTVTLTVNDGTGPVTNSIVLTSCNLPLQISAGENQTFCSTRTIVLTPTIISGNPPYTYHWGGSGLSCYTCQNPEVTISQYESYYLTVTDAHSHSATSTVSYWVSPENSLMQMQVENTPGNCGNQTEFTTAIIINGNLPYTVNWGDGDTSTGGTQQTHSYTQSGPEIIQVIDSQGCVTTTLDTITSVGLAVTLQQAIQPACAGTSSGTIVVSVTGGTPPYNYLWSNAANTDSITNLASGSYAVSVTDASTCNAYFVYTLNPESDGNYYVFLNAVNPNCGSPGSVTANVYGGLPPYRYFWTTLDTTSSINVTGGGFNYYGVFVTDSLGCMANGYVFIQNNCSSFITGTAFADDNDNCVFDGGEQPLQDAFVIASSSTGEMYYAITDQNGQYSIEVPDTGNYGLTLYNEFSICGNVSLCGNSNQTVYLSTLGGTSANNNFAITSSAGFDLGVFPSWTSANPGFEKDYWIYYYNIAPQPFSGTATVAFKYDSNLIYMGSDVPPTSYNAANDSITWNVNITGNDYFDVIGAVYFKVPLTLPLTYQLQTKFWIYPSAGDCDTSNNYLHFSEIVTGSHDPNEKEVQPAGNITADDSVLTYTIHFQNTGTDSTHFIVVVDTLSPSLDPATVRNLAASYKYSDFKVTGQGILTWTFNPYRLVDSITNPSGSKGFVSFSVKQKKNLLPGTPISNTASIYFDYNEPVVTNTVTDSIAIPTSVTQVSNASGIIVTAFPNPFSASTNIVVTGINEKYDFELFDLTGRLQNRIPQINTNRFEIMRNQLADGVYLYRLLVAGKPAAYGKLVVQ